LALLGFSLQRLLNSFDASTAGLIVVFVSTGMTSLLHGLQSVEMLHRVLVVVEESVVSVQIVRILSQQTLHRGSGQRLKPVKVLGTDGHLCNSSGSFAFTKTTSCGVGYPLPGPLRLILQLGHIRGFIVAPMSVGVGINGRSL